MTDDAHIQVPCAVDGCQRHAVARRPLATLTDTSTLSDSVPDGHADPDRSVPLCLPHFAELSGLNASA